MPEVRLMTLDPGHFHAALIQREMYPGVAARVDVYAPEGWDLAEHLKRVDAFNKRTERPTAWDTQLHIGPDFFDRMLRERPGNAVILSGKNRPKIDRIARSVHGGLHVLADKPWILTAAELPQLEAVLAEADQKGVVAYDIMTERFEITSMLQRALVNDPATFGEIVKGTEADPGVYMESVHHLMKVVAGAPNIRPPWFFDTAEQGEGLNDIGTHLVDLVQWTLFPDKAVDYQTDLRVLAAQRWPTVIPEADFRRVTGLPGFDRALAGAVKDGKLEYFANTLVLVCRARRAHEVERDLGLGSAGGWRRHAFRVLPRHARARRGPPDRCRSLPARALRRAGVAGGESAGPRRDAGPHRGAAGHLSRSRRRRARLRDPHRRAGGVASEPRSALRPGGDEFPGIHPRSPHAARVGAAQHAREVLRHDERDRVEPPDARRARRPASLRSSS